MGTIHMMEPVNPYSAGPMVTTEEMFFGRDNERRRLRSNLLNMVSCSIVGLRRIGKSSLLYYLSHHEILPSEHKFLFAYIDLQEKDYHTLNGLLVGAFRQWKQDVTDGVYTTSPGNLSEFSRAVRWLRNKGYQPVLCLDEFENLTKRSDEFGDDTFETWRALANERQIVFVTSSLKPLADLIQSEGLTSSFYNIFYQLDLGLLDRTSASDLITIPMANQGLVVPTSVEYELLEFCGYYPYYLQMGAFYFCDALISRKSYELITVKNDILGAADRHWKGLWGSLSTEEKQAFLKVIEEKGTSEMELQLRNLVRKGLIMQEGNRMKPFSQGFSSWVRSQSKGSELDYSETKSDSDQKLAQGTEEPPDSTTEKSTPNQTEREDVNIILLLVATGVTLIVLVVAAWVLTTLLEIKSVGSLILILAVAFPFILVLVGKLAGQDFIAWLGDLLRRNQ